MCVRMANMSSGISMKTSRRPLAILLALACLAVWGMGCAQMPHSEELTAASTNGPRSFDMTGDGSEDLALPQDADGRVRKIILAGNDRETVALDALTLQDCRHLVLILDGVAYDVLKQYYDEGHFRFFHPPSRLISPYPTLTDLALCDALALPPTPGFEALYFDHWNNRLAGGTGAYLRGENMPYNAVLDYRNGSLVDAISYVAPWTAFEVELVGTFREVTEATKPEVRSYLVSTAGISTKDGKAGQIRLLGEVERMLLRLLWETRGRVKITLLSDHGHSYTPAERIDLEEYLTQHGWTLNNSLTGRRDVVYVRFGLVTYASFATRDPAALAADLIDHVGVELASYTRWDKVVVLGPDDSRAEIGYDGEGYTYEMIAGDPLRIADTLSALPTTPQGSYRPDDLLAGTHDAYFPIPLQRLWRTHFHLARHRPDVVVSLADRFYSGTEAFSVPLGSTHGSLNRINSTAFVMSTIGPLPPVMRSRDIPAAMAEMLGADHWPTPTHSPEAK